MTSASSQFVLFLRCVVIGTLVVLPQGLLTAGIRGTQAPAVLGNGALPVSCKVGRGAASGTVSELSRALRKESCQTKHPDECQRFLELLWEMGECAKVDLAAFKHLLTLSRQPFSVGLAREIRATVARSLSESSALGARSDLFLRMLADGEEADLPDGLETLALSLELRLKRDGGTVADSVRVLLEALKGRGRKAASLRSALARTLANLLAGKLDDDDAVAALRYLMSEHTEAVGTAIADELVLPAPQQRSQALTLIVESLGAGEKADLPPQLAVATRALLEQCRSQATESHLCLDRFVGFLNSLYCDRAAGTGMRKRWQDLTELVAESARRAVVEENGEFFAALLGPRAETENDSPVALAFPTGALKGLTRALRRPDWLQALEGMEKLTVSGLQSLSSSAEPEQRLMEVLLQRFRDAEVHSKNRVLGQLARLYREWLDDDVDFDFVIDRYFLVAMRAALRDPATRAAGLDMLGGPIKRRLAAGLRFPADEAWLLAGALLESRAVGETGSGRLEILVALSSSVEGLQGSPNQLRGWLEWWESAKMSPPLRRGP